MKDSFEQAMEEISSFLLQLGIILCNKALAQSVVMNEETEWMYENLQT